MAPSGRCHGSLIDKRIRIQRDAGGIHLLLLCLREIELEKWEAAGGSEICDSGPRTMPTLSRSE